MRCASAVGQTRSSVCLPLRILSVRRAPPGTSYFTLYGTVIISSASHSRPTRSQRSQSEGKLGVLPARAEVRTGCRPQTRSGSGSKGEPRCRAVRRHMRNLSTGKVDFVLVRRGQSNRPRVAAGAVKEIWRAARCVAGRRDVLEADRDAETRQRRLIAKGVIRQNGAAIGRCGGKCADRRGGRNMCVLEIRRDSPRCRIISIDQGKERRIVLE